ncbi:hypothetical protein ACLOJK_030515 [Asimina triloba]
MNLSHYTFRLHPKISSRRRDGFGTDFSTPIDVDVVIVEISTPAAASPSTHHHHGIFLSKMWEAILWRLGMKRTSFLLGDFMDLTTAGRGDALVVVDALVLSSLRRVTLPQLGRKKVVSLFERLRVALLLL